MKPEELFTGAWVTTRICPEHLFQVKGMNDVFVYGIKNGSVFGPFFYEDIIPIPITPEILEKFGFEHRGRYYLIFDDPSLALKSELQGNRLIFVIGHLFGCNNFHAFIELQSVHELQAAMRLCGIEKEIVL